MIRKIITFSVIVAACYACGGGSESSSTGTDKKTETTAPPTTDLSSNPVYQKGLELISKNDCLTCHKVDEKVTGPAYRDVANKYPNDEKTIDSLVQKVIKGGTGVWGQVPMTPHPNLSPDDAKQIIQYIMLLKNK